MASLKALKTFASFRASYDDGGLVVRNRYCSSSSTRPRTALIVTPTATAAREIIKAAPNEASLFRRALKSCLTQSETYVKANTPTNPGSRYAKTSAKSIDAVVISPARTQKP